MKNIKSWMNALGFEQNGDHYSLIINSHKIEVDIQEQKIIYPKLKEIGRNTTTNLSSEENFVVLDIIIGLLKQGYSPDHISIEKGYKLGHNTKSGNADVTVDDNEGNPFLIIEAKTFGTEFEKEWKNTQQDGGQLFSYEKQENKAQVLVLYASEVKGNEINSTYRAITLKDNTDFLATLENPKGYKDAKGGNDKFEIWRDTYQYDYVTNGILEEYVKPFEILKVKARTSDLKIITHEEVQKKYNEFATILRKHNIGGRENAFDKLVNLFLSKIVDEQQNKDDLQFTWKGVAYDSYFELVDRLQKLYQIGMEKFLDEKVTYVAEKDVEDAFRLRKDAAKDAILKYFKELKYYSNNDFTFLDVYNEQLFYQNSKILVEIVQMLQNMQLRTDEQNQFLGDLFEGFLDSGVKQSEGQFFTPLPIVKFIVSSLPVENINDSTDIPKVIDYACGAGHFLNEYAEQLKTVVDKEKLSNYYSSIFGIEKEYRLSKVAKVSAFMYGQDDINIIYGDGLVDHNQVKNNSFSVLIANPPYSVKGFLETLSDKDRNHYALMKFVDKLDTNNSIELFFLERANQLLKSEGVAAIIVPSSVLSNSNLYIKARKMLIENFNIIAISEFGSKTFGSTGTNTITLFLEKKKYPPKEADNYKYAVERWFNKNEVLSSDIDIIKSYCKNIDVNYEDYKELQNGQLNNILEAELFSEYIEDFHKTTTYKNILNKKITKKFSEEDRKQELETAKFNFIKAIEQEKVYYFALANSQKQDVVIVKCPTDNTEMKEFLGYDWSKRKGSEGIKYIGSNMTDDEMEVSKNQAIKSIQTPLFNPIDLNDEDKINTIIRNNFINGTINIPTELEKYVSSFSLGDMLDFNHTTFDAQIKTSVEKKIEIKSKYPIFKLGNPEISKITSGNSAPQGLNYYDKGTYPFFRVSDVAKYHLNSNLLESKDYLNEIGIQGLKLFQKGSILFPKSGQSTYLNHRAMLGVDGYVVSHLAVIKANNINILDKFLYEYLTLIDARDIKVGSGYASLNISDLEKLTIPVPPIPIQEQLIAEVDELDKQYENSRMKIEEYREKIKEIFESLEIFAGGGGMTYKLSSKNDFSLMIGKRVLNKDLKVDGIPVYSANVFAPFGLIDKDIIKDFTQPSILWGIDGDWMVNTIPAGNPFYPTDHTGVLRVKTDQINYRYLAYKLEKEGVKEGFSRSYRASMGQIEKIVITVPDINKQNEAVNEVERLEKLIAQEFSIMKSIGTKKEDVIKNYLR